MSTIDLILYILNEREGWHDIEKVAARIDVPISEVREIINFMAKNGFVTIDPTGKEVKLGYLMHEFLEEICAIESEECDLKV